MKKFLGVMFMISLFGFGVMAHAQTTEPVPTPAGTPTPTGMMYPTRAVNDQAGGNVMWDKWQDKESGKGHMMGYNRVSTGGGSFGVLWIIGWIFTIGYLGLSFWKGLLALIVWPYYLGKFFKKPEVVKS